MLRLVVRGELDMATAPALRSRIEAVERRRTPVLGIDLGDLSFMDASGVRVVVDAARRAKAEGRRIVVLNPRGPIQRLLELTAIDAVLEVAYDQHVAFPKVAGAVHFTLPGGRAAARDARRALSEADGLPPGRVLEDVLLLLSELVTNAVRHGGVGRQDHVKVQAETDAGSVHVRVSDPGPGFREPREQRYTEPGGWGLVLVSKLASDWGVERRGSETTVWFEYPLSAQSELGPA